MFLSVFDTNATGKLGRLLVVQSEIVQTSLVVVTDETLAIFPKKHLKNVFLNLLSSFWLVFLTSLMTVVLSLAND